MPYCVTKRRLAQPGGSLAAELLCPAACPGQTADITDKAAQTNPDVTAFFDEPTNTISYVVREPGARACAVIGSVLDFDYG